jgi:D-threo-aldose 1-dehydrogenase
MRERSITRTGLAVTELGFGAASIGNLYRETTDADAEEAVDAAWALGIRYFDTAPHYGLGLSEHRLGHALRKYPRDEYVLSTKVGRLLVPNERRTGQDSDGFIVTDDTVRQWDFSRDGVRRSLDASLARLGLDRVDILYAHDPDQSGPDAGVRVAPFLAELREQGVVTSVGVGTNSGQEAARLLERTDIDLAMLAGRYTLLEQDSLDDALRVAATTGKSIVAVGAFNSGLLATENPSAGARYDYKPAEAPLIARVLELSTVCAQFGVTVPQAAIAFPLSHPSVVNVTLGMRNAAQVQRNVELYQAAIPSDLWDVLKAEGLLRADVPTETRGQLRLGMA